MDYLRKYWKKYRALFLLSVFCVAVEAICDLLQPRIMAELIDDGVARGDLDFVLRTGLRMLGVVAFGALFAMGRNAASSYVSQSFGAELRKDIFIKVQSFRPDDIDGFDGGSLVTRLTNDVTQLQNFANGLMRIFFKAPVICIGAIVMAISLDLKIIPIIIPLVSLVFIVISITMHLAYPRFSRVQTALDAMNVTLREYLGGIRLVKAFRRFQDERRRFGAVNGELADSTVSANRVLVVFSPFMTLFANIGIAALLFFGARWVGAGELKVGQIMAFVTYVTQIIGSLNMISNVLNLFVRVKTSHGRIAEVMEVSTPTRPGDGRFVPEEESFFSGRSIIFENVGFRYKNSTGQAALANISFSVSPGETLGVIGPTGSGKSTLAALLLRLYEPADGCISVGSIPSAGVSERRWREHAAIVPQTPTLFSGTIRENILWGNPDATAREIEDAAVSAQADEFIRKMEDGYDSRIGQSGVNLSGGQKQRISIARALIRKPDLLVLDDCTSALDVVTESEVKKALLSYRMACVWITQRVSTAMSCDRILVLENGEQAGWGTHEELLENCPVYRDIFVSQVGKEAICHE